MEAVRYESVVRGAWLLLNWDGRALLLLLSPLGDWFVVVVVLGWILVCGIGDAVERDDILGVFLGVESDRGRGPFSLCCNYYARIFEI